MEMIESRLLHMHDVAVHIAEAEGCSFRDEYAAQERACAACEVTADWQDCLDAFGRRTVGGFIAEWADEAEYHPHESSGIALLDIGDGNSVVAYWSDDGGWNVDIETEARARMALEDYARDWQESEEDDSEEDDSEGEEA